jgi:acetyl-CoA carboxylase biotin carboxyl carrier protein
MSAAKTAKPVAKVPPRSVELTLIDNLADILNSTGLTEIELEQKGMRVRVSRSVVVQHQAAAAPAMPSNSTTATAAPLTKTEAVKDQANGVKSPMVGTAYLASGPDSPPFVTVGATVKQGQTLLIIEAMKTMNQIPAPRSGKVLEINIENGQPVEFGEVLMVIE